MPIATKKNLYLDRESMHVDDYDVPVTDQISIWMKDMKLIREYVRNILFENMVSVPHKIMNSKLEKLIDEFVPPTGWQVNHRRVFSSGAGNGNELYVQVHLQGTRESLQNLNSEDIKSNLRSIYGDFVARRGWNLLKIREEPLPSRYPTIMFELKFDKQPNPKNTNFFMSTQDLQIKEYVLLHLTKKKYLKSIQSGGFKPARASSDGISYGNGRSYFITCSRMDWEDARETAIGWFEKATETSGFAGIDPEEEQVLLVLDPEKMRNNIHFYIDTEFGHGSGTIGYSGVWGGTAIYTPGHIRHSAIEEIIDL